MQLNKPGIREDSRPGMRPRPHWPRHHRAWTVKQLLPLIRAEVLRLSTDHPSELAVGVTKEVLAVQFRAKESLVAHCLHLLNLEGLVSQPRHAPLHDSNRDPWTLNSTIGGWTGDVYWIYGPKSD